MAGFTGAPPIVTDGLIFAVDAANYESYTSGSSTWYDLSGNSNNGTLTNGPTFDSGNGGSIVFDGTDDHIALTTIEPQYFSLCSWFKATGVPSNNDASGGALITGNNQLISDALPYFLSYSWTTQRVILVVQSNNNLSATPNNSVLQNTIYNVVGTYDGTYRSIYINGELLDQDSWSTDPIYPSSGDRTARIGKWGYSSYQRHFNGHIYNTSIYNKALTASEVLQNYNALKSRFNL